MPFDGRTYKAPVKVAREFTTEEFLEWAKTKNPVELYDVTDARRCAIGQFFTETGRAEHYGYWVSHNTWRHLNGEYYTASDVNSQVWNAAVFSRTFGKLAKKLQPSLGTRILRVILGV